MMKENKEEMKWWKHLKGIWLCWWCVGLQRSRWRWLGGGLALAPINSISWINFAFNCSQWTWHKIGIDMSALIEQFVQAVRNELAHHVHTYEYSFLFQRLYIILVPPRRHRCCLYNDITFDFDCFVVVFKEN